MGEIIAENVIPLTGEQNHAAQKVKDFEFDKYMAGWGAVFHGMGALLCTGLSALAVYTAHDRYTQAQNLNPTKPTAEHKAQARENCIQDRIWLQGNNLRNHFSKFPDAGTEPDVQMASIRGVNQCMPMQVRNVIERDRFKNYGQALGYTIGGLLLLYPAFAAARGVPRLCREAKRAHQDMEMWQARLAPPKLQIVVS